MPAATTRHHAARPNASVSPSPVGSEGLALRVINQRANVDRRGVAIGIVPARPRLALRRACDESATA
jgi:hypothetical protein